MPNTVVDVEPLFLSNSVVAIATDDYAAAISSCVLTPTSSTVTFKGLKPGSVFTRNTASTWVCAIAYVQDWETADSLSNYLHAHEGETVSATITPDDGGASVAVSLNIIPGSIGGAVDTFGTATVNLGVQGKPTITPAA